MTEVVVIAAIATIVLLDCSNRLLPIEGATTDIGSTMVPG